MDITSYLLGKKSSGGSSSGINWNEIGFDSTPESIQNGFDYAKQIMLNWNPDVVTLSNKFYEDANLIIMPLVEIGENTVNADGMFYYCYSLIEIPQLDFSNVVKVNNMFNQCYALKKIPQLDFSSVQSISDIVSNCYNLEILGGFKDLGKAYLTTQSQNYYNYSLNLSRCRKLTHDSLMNVINNLYDIASAGVNTQSLVLGNVNLQKLTADEIAIATNKGWTVS